MDRNEAVLRELNLYPQWVRREPPAPPESVAAVIDAAVAPVAEAEPAHAETIASHEVGRAQRIPEPDPIQPDPTQLDWPELKARVRDCTACDLRGGCTQTVFGVGDERADWLFVGEAPGAEEDAGGEPFVGEAGKLLDNMLLALRLKRGSGVYIANIVKCHPPENRVPDAGEVAACLPYLKRQIALIRPKVIVALGKTAATALLRMGDAEGIGSPSASPSRGLHTGDVPLGSLRGAVHESDGFPLIVTYHPAYLLRSPQDKAKAWQDLRLAQQRLRAES